MRTATAALLLLLVLAGQSLFGQSLIQDTKHNLSASGPGSIKAASETEICVFCHTPHGASALAQLWNRQPTTQTYALYASDYLTSLTYAVPTQPNVRSKLCMSCHDGTIALGSVVNMPGPGGAGTIAMEQSGSPITTMPAGTVGYLGISLTDDHPVGYLYDTAQDPELVVRAWPWNTAVKLDPDSSTGRVECQSCHDPHNNQYGKFLRMSNVNAALCTHCHNKTNYAASAHPNATGASYTPPGGSATTVGEHSCRSCHKPHSSGGTPYVLRAVEQNTCYESGCHGTLNPGVNTTPAARLIQPELSKARRHPVDTYDGRHKNRKYDPLTGKETPAEMSDGANRHAECMDCHNPHQAQQTITPITARGAIGISAALKGVWGVQPTFPVAPVNMTTNIVTFAPITQYTRVENPTDEYQVCLKCHSNYVTLPAGARNIAQEINYTNSSYHGIVPGGTSNTFVNATTANEPWASNKRVWCSDCHGSEAGSGVAPKGPHGSNNVGVGPGTSNSDRMLVATIATDQVNGGTPLCLVCHKSTSYLTGNTGSNNSRHGADTNPSRAPEGCFSCHMWENPVVVTGGTGDIFPHGMNKRWALIGVGPAAGSLQMVDAFNGGWYTNIDYQNKTCWTTDSGGKKVPSGSPCNSHTNQGY